jgi:hypothetical protein
LASRTEPRSRSAGLAAGTGPRALRDSPGPLPAQPRPQRTPTRSADPPFQLPLLWAAALPSHALGPSGGSAAFREPQLGVHRTSPLRSSSQQGGMEPAHSATSTKKTTLLSSQSNRPRRTNCKTASRRRGATGVSTGLRQHANVTTTSRYEEAKTEHASSCPRARKAGQRQGEGGGVEKGA